MSGVSQFGNVNSLTSRGYHIGQEIGEGMFSNVYLAKHVDQHGRIQYLACKTITKRKCTQEFWEKFLPRELRILVQLNHPYVVRTFQVLKNSQRVFIFMQYATKGDLREFIDDNGPLRETHAKKWGLALLQGLLYLHQKGIAHRDIKCENIFVTESGTILLGDFGFAKQFPTGRRRLSKTFCGSVCYAAPEIIAGDPYDPMVADVWSAGVVLYVMLNGKLPFRERNLARLLKRQTHRWYRFNSVLKLSSSARAVVMVMLQPIVSDRFRVQRLLDMDWFRLKSVPLARRSFHGNFP